jgi:iron complex outermembrane recepter protein
MRLAIFAFSILFFHEAMAQNILSGKITDAKDSEALIGATVYITDLKRGAVTDIEGFYSLGNLPKGNFLVEVKYAGYANKVSMVAINGNTEFNVKLTEAVTELSEVVVTGISHSSEVRQSPIPITTIGTEAISEQSATNLVDNISKQAGISQITTGSAVSKPVVRGLSYNRVITLYDGIRQEGQQWGDEHGIEIDEYSVSRVEIIKGAGSLMYGSDGLGGVINFLAPNPEQEGTVKGKWQSNFQTNNGLISNSLSLSGNNHGIYWLGHASHKNVHPYSNRYDGKVFNSGFNELDFNGTLGINDDWGFTQVNVSSFNQNLGLTEGDRDENGDFVRPEIVGQQVEDVKATPAELSTYKLFIPKQSIHHVRVSSNTNYYKGATRIQLDAGYQYNIRKEFGNIEAENNPGLHFDLRSYTYNLILYLPPVHNFDFSVGSSGMFQKNLNKGGEFLIPDYHFFDWGLFAFAKWHYKALDVAGGIRYDQRILRINALHLDENGMPSDNPNDNQKFVGRALQFSNYSASLGITQALTKSLTAKLNLSRGFRAPSVAEISSNGRHEGTLQYEYGNPTLAAETSFQLDVGLILQSEHVTIEAAFFRNFIDQYIYLKKLLSKDGTDSIPDPQEPVPAYQYTQGNARLMGGEFSVDLHPHPFDWLHLENTFSLVDAVNESESGNDSTRYLPFIPAPAYRGEVRANIGKIGRDLINSFFVIEFTHKWKKSNVLLDNGTETPTTSYSLWNSGLGTSLKKRNGGTLMTLYFFVNNIFDKGYQDHLNRLKYAAENPTNGLRGVFNMGRNFSIKLVVPFSLREDKKG